MYDPNAMLSRGLSETRKGPHPPESSSTSDPVRGYLNELDFNEIAADIDGVMNAPAGTAHETHIEEELGERLSSILDNAAEAVRGPLENLLTAGLFAGALAMWLRLAHREADATERALMRRRADEWAARETAAILAHFRARVVASIAERIRAARTAAQSAADAVELLRRQFAPGGPIEKQFSGYLDDASVASNRYGGIVAAGALGYATKFWITEQDARVCATCNLNESQDPIPLEAAFHSGHLHPPAHPNCRCWLDFK